MRSEAPESEQPKRIIKRYSNRKLYDTKDSRYVTLAQIGDLVRTGEEVQIIDNATKEDKTEATLALIISEEVKTRPKAVPISALRELVAARGEKLLTSLREGPIGRLFPNPEDEAKAKGEGGTQAQAAATEDAAKSAEPGKNRLQELVDSSRQTLEEWQAAIDERVKAVMPAVFTAHQDDLKSLTQRIEALEAQVQTLQARLEGTPEKK